MPTKVNAFAPAQDGPAYSIARFCAYYGISRDKYYVMKHQGTGPQEARIGKSVRILHWARMEWEAAMVRAANPAPDVEPTAEAAKRGRGRPKGSKNKADPVALADLQKKTTRHKPVAAQPVDIDG